MLTILPTGRVHYPLGDARLEYTGGDVELLGRSSRHDVEFENVHWQTDGGARVRYVHYTRDVTLYRSTGEKEVDLVVTVAEPPQVLDDACTTVTVS